MGGSRRYKPASWECMTNPSSSWKRLTGMTDCEKCSISEVKASNGEMVTYAYDGTEWSRTYSKDGERIKA